MATRTAATRTTAAAKKPPEKDPEGGLTAAGRKAFNERDGSHLKPGVKGPADTPDKMKRKGSFLRRHYANLSGPLLDENGKPTRLSLQAQAWGEPAPKTAAAAARLAEKGAKLLERYERGKDKLAAAKVKAKARAETTTKTTPKARVKATPKAKAKTKTKT